MRQNKNAAIVTGASSGIGMEISRKLSDLGYRVYGFGRDFTKTEELAENIIPVAMDLNQTEKLLNKIEEIKKQEQIQLLVNAAGVGYFGLHEELNPEKIKEMVRTNLEVPMILSQQLLRELKKNQGTIIYISSITAKETNPHGCAYGATKAGISSFARSLFAEARKYGVRVVTIHPDLTKTEFYRNADFCQGEEEDSFLYPQEVAEAVEQILTLRQGMTITDLTLQPQKHRIQKK